MSKQITSISRYDEAARRGAHTGVLSEIFCSVQGEGLYVGERQVFVRTAGCSATCYWCDTVSSKKERRVCLVHGTAKQVVENPVAVPTVCAHVLRLIREAGPVRTVSLTGGEPLEQPEFVTGLARSLRERGLRIYLETSGIEFEALSHVVEFVDVVAMDVKLPHATGVDHWPAHEKFLRLLAGKNAFVKIVVDAVTPPSELARALDRVADADPSRPVVLQPESATYLKSARGAAGRRRVQQLVDESQRLGLRRLSDVRVIPQCHKILKVR